MKFLALVLVAFFGISFEVNATPSGLASCIQALTDECRSLVENIPNSNFEVVSDVKYQFSQWNAVGTTYSVYCYYNDARETVRQLYTLADCVDRPPKPPTVVASVRAPTAPVIFGVPFTAKVDVVVTDAGEPPFVSAELGLKFFAGSQPAQLARVSLPNSVGAKVTVDFPVIFQSSEAGFRILDVTDSPEDNVIFGASPNAVLAGSPPAEIQITGAKVVQVISDPETSNGKPGVADIVMGKSLSFTVRMRGTNLQSASGSVFVRIFQGTTEVSRSRAIPVADIAAGSIDGPNIYVIEPGQIQSYVFTSEGQLPLTFKLDSSQATNVRIGPPYSRLSVNVRKISPLSFGFAQVDAPACVDGTSGCYGNVSAVQVASSLSSDSFVSAAFPVPDHAYAFKLTGGAITGSSGSALRIGMYQDFIKLETARMSAGNQRMVGLVPSNYFLAHGEPASTTGFTFHKINSVTGEETSEPVKTAICVAGSPEVIPHEFGHSIARAVDMYQLNTTGNGVYTGTPVTGYDALNHVGYVYPYPSGAHPAAGSAISIMGPSGLGLVASSGAFNYWMDDSTYTAMLSAFMAAPPKDPETVLVSGLLLKSGEFLPGPAINLPNGEITESEPAGDLSISLLDASGVVIGKTNISTNLKMMLSYSGDAPGGPTEIETIGTPVILQMPKNPEAVTIQLSKSNQVLFKTDLNGQVLLGLIGAIPDGEFKIPPECNSAKTKNKTLAQFCGSYLQVYRKALAVEVEAIQKLLNSKNSRFAIIPLKLLEIELKLITDSRFIVANTSELSQTQVIAGIDVIIGNTANRSVLKK